MIGPLAGTAEVTAVMLTGGSAFGLARRRRGRCAGARSSGRGYATPGGLVPIVPGGGDLRPRDRRPGGAAGRRGRLRGLRGGGRGGARARPGRRRHRGRGRQDRRARAARRATGVGYAAGADGPRPDGRRARGRQRVRRRDRRGRRGRWPGSAPRAATRASTAAAIAAMERGCPTGRGLEERNTTLVCVITDAPLDKPACSRVARMASGGRRPRGRPGVLRRRRRRRLLHRLRGAAERRPLRRAWRRERSRRP